LQGLGAKATSMFPEGLPYHVDLPDLAPDPKLAMELLDKVGLKDPDGKGPMPRFSFTLKVTTNKERISVAKALAAQLKRIGIEVRVESLEFGTFNKQLADGLASAWVLSWTGYKDPDHLRYVFESSQTPPVGGNRGRYSNPKVDKLLQMAQMTQQMDKRVPMYTEAQKIMAEDLPYVYLWYKYTNVVLSKAVKGYKVYSDGRYSSLTEVTKN
jgi:peptide/nickel transport system substrate-binding protein